MSASFEAFERFRWVMRNGFSVLSVLISVAILSIVMTAVNNFMVQVFQTQVSLQDSVDVAAMQAGLQSLLVQRGSCKKFLSNTGSFSAAELLSATGIPVSVALPTGIKVAEGVRVPGSSRLGVMKLRLTNAVAMAGVNEYISRLVIGFEKLGNKQAYRERELGVVKLTVKGTSSAYDIEDCTTTLDTGATELAEQASIQVCEQVGGVWDAKGSPKCQIYCEASNGTDNGISYTMPRSPTGTLLKFDTKGTFQLQYLCVSGVWSNITSLPSPKK